MRNNSFSFNDIICKAPQKEESSGRSQEGQCWNWNYMMRFSILISMPILYLFVAAWTSIFATNASVTGSPLHSISIESQRWLLPSASQSPFWSIGQFIHQSIYNVLRHPIHSSIPVFKVMGSLIPKFIHEVQTHHFPTFSPANVCLLFKKKIATFCTVSSVHLYIGAGCWWWWWLWWRWSSPARGALFREAWDREDFLAAVLKAEDVGQQGFESWAASF